MVLAWSHKLTPKQTKAASTIYGQARLEEGVFTKMCQLILSSKAPSTLAIYCSSIKRWNSYALSNSYQTFPPNTMHFSLYVTHLATKKTPLSTFKTLRAAMPFYYAARNSIETPVTRIPYVKLLLDGASREAAKNRGPIKKAATLDQASLREVLIFSMWPTGSECSPSRCLKDWRTAVKLYTYYKTLCRFDCYMKLTPCSFTFEDSHLIISFTSAKNDQMYNGSVAVLAYTPGDLLCPFLVYKTYFKMMDFALNHTENLNCRLTQTGKSRPITRLSYGTSLSDTKELLTRFGHLANFSEKSFKSSGVSIILDKGTPLTDVQIYGRWASERTPLVYHDSSTARRASISLLL